MYLDLCALYPKLGLLGLVIDPCHLDILIKEVGETHLF